MGCVLFFLVYDVAVSAIHTTRAERRQVLQLFIGERAELTKVALSMKHRWRFSQFTLPEKSPKMDFTK